MQKLCSKLFPGIEVYKILEKHFSFSNNLYKDILNNNLKDEFKNYIISFINNYEYDFSIPNYVKVNDKYYKYNMKLNDIYYCPDNIIINNSIVNKFNSDKILIFDYYILRIDNKKIDLYDKNLDNSFIKEIGSIKNIQIRKDKETSTKDIIINNKILIKLDDENNMLYHEELKNDIKILKK